MVHTDGFAGQSAPDLYDISTRTDETRARRVMFSFGSRQNPIHYIYDHYPLYPLLYMVINVQNAQWPTAGKTLHYIIYYYIFSTYFAAFYLFAV